MSYTLTLQSKKQLTPDVHQYVFDKPEGLSFKPGQATELTILKEG